MTIRKTVIQTINEVEKKLSMTPSSAVGDSQYGGVLLQLLNETVADMSDFGQWREVYAEVSVAASGGQSDYVVPASGATHVQSIHEVAYTDRISPLELLSITDINRLKRVGGKGTPNQYCILSVDASANPTLRVHPAPSTASSSGRAFTVAYWKKPQTYVTADASVTVPFPSNVVVQGLYANALLEENGGEPTNEYRTNLARYERAKSEALNRFDADSTDRVSFRPGFGRWRA